MREPKANSPRERPRRSWRIADAVEQARTMGKRPAGPGYDRSPLDPIFGSGPRIVVSQFFRWRFVRPYTVLESACPSARHPKEIL